MNFEEGDYSIMEGESGNIFQLQLRRIQNPIVINLYPVNFTVARNMLGANFPIFLPDDPQVVGAMEGMCVHVL